MRGGDRQQGTMWSRISPEDRVPADHPLRPLRRVLFALFDHFDHGHREVLTDEMLDHTFPSEKSTSDKP